ncbi:aminotransferase class IV [Brevibacterium litoralis]|uniref:aminotransferase class IV n=1 Tax=Brevibacterium litoralis TaxID=3138935 RepID=UPI0032EC4096
MENSLVLIDPATGTHRIADPTGTHLRVDDLAPHRGDGIFETVLVTLHEDGTHLLHAQDPHFTRFIESARILELPTPDADLFHTAIDALLADFRAKNPGITSLSVRYSLSRGLDTPTAWAMTIPLDPAYTDLQRTGIRMVTADKGYDAYLGAHAPWLLLGAKTLSYATNQAVGRYAKQQGADDALFVSHDGIVLEGPTSNIIIRRGDELVTPDPKAGLLHGTTQRTVFERAGEAGLMTTYGDITVEDVLTADGVWMLSSVRMAVPVTALDGADLTVDAELTERFTDWILHPA